MPDAREVPLVVRAVILDEVGFYGVVIFVSIATLTVECVVQRKLSECS